MDALLAARLNEESSHYDNALYRRLAKMGRDYVQAGVSVLDYYSPDFDVCSDMVNCFASGLKTDLEKRNRSDPENFIHPMAATELWTLATFVSQILFGGETARHVEPRNPEDEDKADIVNELLAWNDGQQPTYTQGFHWCLDALTYNRGVMYDRWEDMMEVHLESVEYSLPWEAPRDPETNEIAINPETGKKWRKPKDFQGDKRTRFKKVRKKVGGFVKIENLSSYDFICDPTIPTNRFQKGRFAGHRVVLTWQELKRRSELPVEDYEYVLPKVVQKLKNSKAKKISSMTTGASLSQSRSFFERQRRNQPVTTITGSDKVDKEDGGVVECFCLQVRARPKAYDIFDDDEDELIELLMSGDTELLSANVTTCIHDQFPYAIGEGRPNAHMQFSPSWTLIIKGPSDYANYLKNRHHDSIARTTGNIFVLDPECIDIDQFTDPNRDGLFITLKPAAAGKPLDSFFKQIPVQDMTAKFHEEMMLWQQTAEQATGAHAAIQGQTEDPSQTLGQFDTVQTMATGRISTIARLLSASALVPQTQRIISNLQQFLPPEIVIRVTGETDAFDPDKPPEKFMTVRRDASEWINHEDGKPLMTTDESGQPIPDPRASLPDIQGNFDISAHDGAMPGTDQKKVAALSRAVEAWSANPALQTVFDPTIPGNIDPRKMFFKLLKATGFPIGDLAVTREQAQKNLQEKQLASGMGTSLPPAATGQPQPDAPPIPAPPEAALGIPSAAVLPPTPPATPPQAHPGNI